MTQAVKYPEHILAVRTAAVYAALGADENTSGWIIPAELPDTVEREAFHNPNPRGDIQRYLPDLTAASLISRRQELETDESFRQYLPYSVLVKVVDGAVKVFVYERGKKGEGEVRLAGKKSIGIGGHVDATDVQFGQQGQDWVNQPILTNTFWQNRQREYAEEVGVQFPTPNGTTDEKTHGVEAGFIIDNSDAVGRVHLGLPGFIILPNDAQVDMIEPALRTTGFVDLDELIANIDEYDFENWSRILLLAKDEDGTPSIASLAPMLLDVVEKRTAFREEQQRLQQEAMERRFKIAEDALIGWNEETQTARYPTLEMLTKVPNVRVRDVAMMAEQNLGVPDNYALLEQNYVEAVLAQAPSFYNPAVEMEEGERANILIQAFGQAFQKTAEFVKSQAQPGGLADPVAEEVDGEGEGEETDPAGESQEEAIGDDQPQLHAKT